MSYVQSGFSCQCNIVVCTVHTTFFDIVHTTRRYHMYLSYHPSPAWPTIPLMFINCFQQMGWNCTHIWTKVVFITSQTIAYYYIASFALIICYIIFFWDTWYITFCYQNVGIITYRYNISDCFYFCQSIYKNLPCLFIRLLEFSHISKNLELL